MRQPPRRSGRLAQGQHLGVRGGIGAQLALVARGRDHLPLADDHRADRDVVVLRRPLGLAQREAHEVLVAGEEGQVVRTM